MATMRAHVLTVSLEDYFHADSFRPWIREETWYRFEDRLPKSTQRTLDLLDRCDARATFFVGRSTAQSAPDLVREVATRGHEIACRGDHRCSPAVLGPARFHQHAMQCRDQLEEVIGCPVLGFRMAGNRLSRNDLWMLEVLAECGFLYDSSIGPALGAKLLRYYNRHRAQLSHSLFQEVPISPLAVFGLEVPIPHSGSFRHLPQTWIRNAIDRWDQKHHSDPYVLHFRTWELDADQPRIHVAPMASRIRHYRNLNRMPARLEQVLRSYPFSTVAEYLGLDLDRPRPSPQAAAGPALRDSVVPRPAGLLSTEPERNGAVHPTPVTIVIPCFNESQSLGYLSNTLHSVAAALRDEYAFTFLFVDDGSTDSTWAVLQKLFGARSDCRLIQHERNQGLARTIQTGIRHADTPVVCSMDCDCTYDPHELRRMIPLLTEGVDLVTASPYHPSGAVRNVPGWRLFLSKSLSRLYRLVLHQKLYTYTSCFRVYRREAVVNVPVGRGGFFGMTEMLGHLDLQGRRIVEFPATLEVRMLGRSKMKIVPTIAGHLGLLVQLVAHRLRLVRLPQEPTVE